MKHEAKAIVLNIGRNIAIVADILVLTGCCNDVYEFMSFSDLENFCPIYRDISAVSSAISACE